MHIHRIGAAALAVALTLLLSVPAQAQQVRITGGGASFPFPLYASWFRHFNRENRGVLINYQSVGSGTGVRNFINRTFDFGASDAAMTDEEIAQVRGGALILPMTAGEIVLAYNLPGIDIEYFFATSTDAQVAMLENAAGQFVAPSDESGQAALAGADLTGKDLRIWVTDPADPAAYPIVTFTWMLFFRAHGNERIGAALRDFVTWALADGQDMAADLGYIPMPKAVVERVRAEIPNIR